MSPGYPVRIVASLRKMNKNRITFYIDTSSEYKLSMSSYLSIKKLGGKSNQIHIFIVAADSSPEHAPP
jgi:hypothetical protein